MSWLKYLFVHVWHLYGGWPSEDCPNFTEKALSLGVQAGFRLGMVVAVVVIVRLPMGRKGCLDALQRRALETAFWTCSNVFGYRR